VMATRVSPAVISAGTPISMGLSSVRWYGLGGHQPAGGLVRDLSSACAFLYLS
jgi:hypothetical protein